MIPTIHIFTFITAAVGTVIHGILIFLILRKKPRDRGSWFLAGWLAFTGFLIHILGSLIIATSDYSLAFRLYRIGAMLLGMFSLFYFFVKEYLKFKASNWLNWLAYLYMFAIVATNIAVPNLFVKGVLWDSNVQFYLGNFELKLLPLVYTGMVFWLYGILKLVQAYRQSHSAVERNRLKYLILGGFLPVLGIILVSLPILTIRRYPLDMWGCTLGAICLAYGVLRYQLLDITIVIRKGLLYSILTTMVTGVHLFFAFVIQHLVGAATNPVSLQAAFSTALVVAVIFQPLRNATQRFVDKVFFRRKYNLSEFVSRVSKISTSTLDLRELTESLVSSILEILQVKKAGLFLVKRGTNRLHLSFSKGLKKEAEQIVFTTDRPLAQLLSQSDEIKLLYDLEGKKIPLEDLDKQDLKLLIPLRSRRKLRGVLALGPKLSEELYSLEELNLLQTVADPAALALENAQLFTQIKEEKERVEELLENKKRT